MTAEERPVVLVAEELEPLVGDPPAWPSGARHRWLPADADLPVDDGVVGLVPLLSRTVGPREMDRLPRLRVVANYAVGYDNVDVAAAAERGVAVTNTPDVLTESTADLTWALLLAAARRLREGLELARSGEWEGWRPDLLLGRDLQGRTLGIVGAGRIGAAVARRAPGFGMRVAYWSRSQRADLERDLGAVRMDDLSELLAAADVVSLHLPLTAATEGILDRDALGAMKEGSVLVNTARGGLVETEALADALRDGPLAAAGLDVYRDEPEIPKALRELPGCFVLPHLGSATVRTRVDMWELAAENVRRVLRGDEPLTPVEPS